VTRYNPYRDVAAGIELGDRARDELMGAEDWREVLAIWAAQSGLPVELIRRARPDLAERAR
jgi:hypothetical protein